MPNKPIGTLPDNPLGHKSFADEVHEQAIEQEKKEQAKQAEEQKAQEQKKKQQNKDTDDAFDKLLKETGQNK